MNKSTVFMIGFFIFTILGIFVEADMTQQYENCVINSYFNKCRKPIPWSVFTLSYVGSFLAIAIQSYFFPDVTVNAVMPILLNIPDIEIA